MSFRGNELDGYCTVECPLVGIDAAGYAGRCTVELSILIQWSEREPAQSPANHSEL